MDYLRRILLILPHGNEDEAFLPHLRELSRSAPRKPASASAPVSPTEEARVSAAAAELLRRYSALEQAADRKVQIRSAGAEAHTAGSEEQRVALTGRYAAKEGNGRVSVDAAYGMVCAPSVSASSEELSRIFQRDARRYG